MSVVDPTAAAPPRARILVVGDANPDLVLTGDVVPRFGQAEQLLEDATLVIGGSASITAHGLARLGRSVGLLAAVGDDQFGRFLLDALSGGGVDVGQLAVRDQLPTGLTVALNRGDDRAILTLLGAIDSLTPEEVQAALEGLATGGTPGHVHVASLFLQPSLAPELPALLERAHELGLTTSMDTNDDPSRQWRGLDPLLPHLDVLLPNRNEASALAGVDDPISAARALAARGPLVVVKDGGSGAICVSPSGDVVESPASPVDPVDTTGAGDTFDAAFLDGWLDQLPLPLALSRAVAAGTLSVLQVGGTAGQPTRDQITEALEESAPLSQEAPRVH